MDASPAGGRGRNTEVNGWAIAAVADFESDLPTLTVEHEGDFGPRIQDSVCHELAYEKRSQLFKATDAPLAQSLHCEPASDCNFGGFRSKGKVSVDARSLPQFGPNQPVLESVRTPDQVKSLEGPGLKVCQTSERRTSIASVECAAGPVSAGFSRPTLGNGPVGLSRPDSEIGQKDRPQD